MDPRETEPIYDYNFITDAEDDGLTLQLPGYFKGEALIGELHYNGGEHGIFVRNKHQLLLCDYIHEGVRELLNNTCDIFISETDSKREYMGRIVHDDIDALVEEAFEFHDFRILYHPEESKRRRTMIQLVSTADVAFLRRKASLIIPMGQSFVITAF